MLFQKMLRNEQKMQKIEYLQMDGTKSVLWILSTIAPSCVYKL